MGVARSQKRDENANAVKALQSRCEIMVPDYETVDFYAAVRGEIERVRTPPQTFEKREGFGHDLWIAALCLQHDVPLLTKDGLFKDIRALVTVGW